MRSSWKRKESRPTKFPKRNSAADSRLLVIGLGNLGSRYAATRHNVGFRVVQVLADDAGVVLKRRRIGRYALACVASGSGRAYIAEPLTMMNRSGEVLAALMRFSNCTQQQLVVICDSIDLPTGALRLKRSGSAGGHNGMASIIAAVGGGDFARLWVGVGRPRRGGDVIGHVLGNPGSEDRQRIEAAERFAAEHLLLLLEEPIDRVMYEINSYDPG